MVRDSFFNRSAMAAAVSACAMLSACGHTNGFTLEAAQQPSASPISASDGAAGSAGADAISTPASAVIKPTVTPTVSPKINTGDVNVDPSPLSALLVPVTEFTGGTLDQLGEGLNDLDNALRLGLAQRVGDGVGNTLEGIGEGLANNGLEGLPLVGDTVGNVVGMFDTASASALGLSMNGRSWGGENALLGVGVLSPAATPGSIATLNVLSGTGGLASLSTASQMGQTTGLNLSGAQGLGDLTSLAGVNALGTPLGTATPLIGLNALTGSSTAGSLATIDVLTNQGLANVGIVGAPTTPSIVNTVLTGVSGVTPPTGATPVNIGGAVSGAQGLVGGLLGLH